MGKKIGIMQPYFLPYMGYWQLISAVDEFVLYDNIEYTKKGWINRNRFLQNGKDALFSLPLKAASDFLPVYERFLADSFEREKLVRQLQEAYRRAPFFDQNFPVIKEIILHPEQNLFLYIENSIHAICRYLDIKTPIIRSSAIAIDHQSLKAEDKVIEICHFLHADQYMNPIGGLGLYDKTEFESKGIDLTFLRSQPLGYTQFGENFLPHLSILDVMMFNDRHQVRSFLDRYVIE